MAQRATRQTKAYAIAEYERGRTSKDIAVELALTSRTVLTWLWKAHVTVRPRFDPNVVIPVNSNWRFIEHSGLDKHHNRVALFECVTPLPNGLPCGNRQTLMVSSVTSRASSKCRPCAMRLRSPKPIVGCGYAWKRWKGAVTQEERLEHNDRVRVRQCQQNQTRKATIHGRACSIHGYARHSHATTRKRLPFDLDIPFIETLLQSGCCNVTSIPFDYSAPRVKGRPNMFVATIDRIESSKGYVKGNVQMVVHAYNNLKSDYPEDEVIAFIKAAYEAIQGRLCNVQAPQV